MEKITLAITNCNAVLENGIIFDATILVSGERIAAVGKTSDIEIPEGTPTIDAEGRYAGPGFVDIHVHGAEGKNINLEPEAVCEYYLKNGTTAILATPWYTMNMETILKCIATVRGAIGKVRTLQGIYMEGPFTNPTYGSHAKDNPWRHGIVEEEYRKIVDAAGTDVKVWTVAPELEGIGGFVSYAKSVNPDAVIAVGHSEATPAEIRALGKHRPTLGTHVTNATAQKGRGLGIVGVGPDEYCLENDEVYCELISDSRGIHVKSDVQRLMLRAKGVDKIVLITDGSTHNNPTPEKYKGVTDINFSPYGEVAGSALTMNAACRNVMSHTRVGITEAFLMASRNPARVIGLDGEIGTIEVGKMADIVLVNDRFDIFGVVFHGERVEV